MSLFGNPIAIIGTGGNSREILCLLTDICSEKSISLNSAVFFIEKDDAIMDTMIMGVPVIPESRFASENFDIIIGPGDPILRKRIASQLPKDSKFITLIHPSVILSSWIEIGPGSVICAGSVLTCNIKLGAHSQLNINTTISHDCTAGDFFTTAPGVNISGNCTIGDQVFIGTNACLKQGLQICSETIIGMGAIVTKNIDKQGKYIGNPARIMK